MSAAAASASSASASAMARNQSLAPMELDPKPRIARDLTIRGKATRLAAAAASASSASASAMARNQSLAPMDLDPKPRITRGLTICGRATRLAAAGGLAILDLFFHSMRGCAPEQNLTLLSKPSSDPERLKRIAKLYAEAIAATEFFAKDVAGLIGEYCPKIGLVALAESSPIREALWNAGLKANEITSRDVLIVAPKKQETVSIRVNNEHPCVVIQILDTPSIAEVSIRPFDTESSFVTDLSIQDLTRPVPAMITRLVVIPVTHRGRDMRLAELFCIAVHGDERTDPSKVHEAVVSNQVVFERMLNETFPSAPVSTPSGRGGGGVAVAADPRSPALKRARDSGSSGGAAAAAASPDRMDLDKVFVRAHRKFYFAGGASLRALLSSPAAAAGGGGGGGAAAAADDDDSEPSLAKRPRIATDSRSTSDSRRTPPADPMDVDADAPTEIQDGP